MDLPTLISLLLPPIQTLGGLGMLMWYRRAKWRDRKKPNGPMKTWKDFFNANLIELIAAGILLPDFSTWISEALKQL